MTGESAGGVSARYDRVMRPESLEALRRAFRRMNRGMVVLWRLGLGRWSDVWPSGFGRLLVLEHVGRRSGREYRTPLNFTRLGEDVYCLAGFGERTDWYRNALNQPDVAVWLADGRWRATAHDASDDPRRPVLIRRILFDSGFAAPMVGLHPRKMSDAQLEDATESYRLLRLSPQERDGDPPRDLTWVWVPIGLAAVGLIWRRTRGR